MTVKKYSDHDGGSDTSYHSIFRDILAGIGMNYEFWAAVAIQYLPISHSAMLTLSKWAAALLLLPHFPL